MCDRTGLHALAANRRYDSVRKRAEHAAEIVPLLHEALAAHTALEWEAIFGDAVPCAAARKVEDMFTHPQVLAEGIVASIEHPVVGSYHGVTQPIKFGRTVGPKPFGAPVFDQDTTRVVKIAETVGRRTRGQSA